ncbi:MAG: site-2 protease family protein [Sedimentisphaerales bacterium]|nr:site-2 protease family protein [Sedimentisphaerales bacterium]
MFGRKLHLFSLFGFKVGVDFTWVLLAVLVTWSLATGLFPYYFKDFSTATYWWMGVAGALGLFISIVFHEFCHSLVARRYGLSMKGITLFIFGGVAEMEDEPNSPKAEFLMAVAGPISSLVLGGVFYGVSLLGGRVAWGAPANAVLSYLALLNVILAVFNLIPAFPLDGGRVLRSALWQVKGNLRWATRVASAIGSGFGVFLIAFGVFSFIGGAFVAGAWYFLIGLFIRGASQMSYQQVLMRKALGGEKVSRFMKEQPVTVPASTSVDELVNNYFYKYHYKMFPVSNGAGLSGCVTTRQIKDIPRDEWQRHTAGEILEPCSPDNTITPDTDALKALALMKRSDKSRLLVAEGDRLLGVLTLKDMLKFLSLKMDLEEQ